MTTVKLVFSLECRLVPNPSQDQNNRWWGCQGGEREKCKGLERIRSYRGIPVEWTSCVFSCVNTQRKKQDGCDTTIAFYKGRRCDILY